MEETTIQLIIGGAYVIGGVLLGYYLKKRFVVWNEKRIKKNERDVERVFSLA